MKSIRMLLQALVFGILILATVLSFTAFGLAHPVPWIVLALLIALPLANNEMEKRGNVQWNSKYSVGVKIIDNDHKQLIDLMNNLKAAVDYRTGECFERGAMDELTKYTQTHFAREEKLMREHDYPGYADHKKKHEAMLARVAEYREDYDQRGNIALTKMAPAVKDWLVDHIYGTDQQYAAFLREKGLLDNEEIRDCCCTGEEETAEGENSTETETTTPKDK